MTLLIHCWIQCASISLRSVYLCSSVLWACSYIFLLYPCWILVLGNVGLVEWIWRCFLLFNFFLKSVCRIGLVFNMPGRILQWVHRVLGFSYFEDFVIMASILLLITGFWGFLLLHSLIFIDFISSGMYSFHLTFSICCHIVLHNCFLIIVFVLRSQL